MITVTRTSEPKEDFSPFTIDRDGQITPRLTRTEAIARLSMFDVEGAERVVDQATFCGAVIIHDHGVRSRLIRGLTFGGNAMPIRIFQGHDIEGFAGVEREINNWLGEPPRGAIVKHLDTTTLHPLNRAPVSW